MEAIQTLSPMDVLADLRGAKFVSFTARTDARARKIGNRHGKIWKTARVNGMVNFQYNEGVLRRLQKEMKSPDRFRRGESWHTQVRDSEGRLTPFLRHKETGELYVRFMLIQRIGEAAYEDNLGRPIAESDIRHLLPEPNTYENQGLDNPLVFLAYKLDSLLSITVDGAVYDFSLI